MKMPGPTGVITVSGNYRRSMDCASASSILAESLVIAQEKKLIHRAVEMAQTTQLGMPNLNNPNGTVAFQIRKETKKVGLDSAYPERTAIIGADLGEK